MPGKLPKSSVLYNEKAPPSFIFQYECQFCALFCPPNQCAVVEGEIKPAAWCVLWFPIPSEPPFLWLTRGRASAE